MTYQITSTEKLRVVTRRDLPFPIAAVQAAHAAVDFQHEHRAEALCWHKTSNYLAVLTAENEESLIGLITKAEIHGIKYTVFREPDLDNRITAVAFNPCNNARKLLSSCPLLTTDLVTF